MTHALRITFLSLLFLLPGCGVFGPIEATPGAAAKTELPEVGRNAQLAINEANVTLATAAVVIRGNIADRVWTKEQSQYYLDKVREYRRQTDAAQKMVDTGDYITGGNMAGSVRSLIVILHREVAAQARKEGAK